MKHRAAGFRAFTLVEVLVALALGLLVVGTASLALWSASQGWLRLQTGEGARLANAGAGLWRLERDVASAHPAGKDDVFEGTESELRVPRTFRRGRESSVDDSAAVDSGEDTRIVWTVGTNLLTRAEGAFLETYRFESGLRFRYEGDGEKVVDSWTADAPTNLPRRVILMSKSGILRAMPCMLSVPGELPDSGN